MHNVTLCAIMILRVKHTSNIYKRHAEHKSSHVLPFADSEDLMTLTFHLHDGFPLFSPCPLYSQIILPQKTASHLKNSFQKKKQIPVI